MKVIDSESQSGKEIMNIDERLLEDLSSDGPPILHLYRFLDRVATFGHFLKPEEYIDLDQAKKWGLNLAKRPTGGGIIFHIWDLPFSVLIPSDHPGYFPDPLKNYAFINNIVLSAIELFLKDRTPLQLLPEESDPLDLHAKSFCMAKPTKYDIMIRSKKIAGAAQRKKKQGYLHQGSISLAVPNFDELEKVLLPGSKVIEAMKLHTASLLGPIDDPSLFLAAQQKMQKLLKLCFSNGFLINSDKL